MKDKIKKYREEITARMVEALKKGTAPWQRPWVCGCHDRSPLNAVSGRRYNGSNALILSLIGFDLDGGTDPRWMTFHQAVGKGWNVKSGEHGTYISFWKNFTVPLKDDDGEPILDDDGNPIMKRFLIEKLFTVFHASQVEGIPPYVPCSINAVESNEKAERIISDSGAEVRYGGSRAFYRQSEDFIQIPSKENFTSTEGYYSTLLHELTHWTGHESRLNRDLNCDNDSLAYAKEELVAEIGSLFLSSETGIPQDEKHFQNHAAYVSSWISMLSSDSNALFKAAAQASKSSDFLLRKEQDRDMEGSDGNGSEADDV